MGSDKKLRVTLYEVASFAASAPVNATAGELVAVDFGSFKDNPGVEFDAVNEAGFDVSESPDIPTVRAGSISGEVPIYGGSKGIDGAGSDTDPTSYYFEKGVKSCFGAAGVATFAGTTVDTGSGPGKTTDLKVVSTANAQPGQMIMVGSEPAFVKVVTDATHLGLDRDVTVYTQNTVVYGSKVFIPTQGELSGAYHYLNVEKTGRKRLYGPGRFVKLSIVKAAAKQGARYAFEFATRGIAAGLTPDTAPVNAFRGNPTMMGIGSPLHIDGTAIPVADFSVDFALANVERPATSGDGGIDGYELTDSMKASMSFTEYYNATRYTQFEAGTCAPVGFVLQRGSTAAAKARCSVGVFFWNAQFKVEPANVNGIEAMKVTAMAKRPTVAQQTSPYAATTNVVFSIMGGE